MEQYHLACLQSSHKNQGESETYAPRAFEAAVRTWSTNYELAANTRKQKLFLCVSSVICKQQLLTRGNEGKTRGPARCDGTAVIYSAVWSTMRAKSPVPSGSHGCLPAAGGAPGYLSYAKTTSIKEESRFIPLRLAGNNASESAAASHYFFKERTKAVLQPHSWWIGRDALASSWISVAGPFNILLSGQQYEDSLSSRAFWKHTHSIVNIASIT